jgi:hypothetical protein
MRGLLCLSFATLFGLQGCNGPSYYAESERALNTEGYYDLLDHIAAYYPRGVALNFPGYVIGLEEAPRQLVAHDKSEIAVDESVYEAGYTVRRLVRAMRFRTQFISHIIRYEGLPYGEGNCSLYNLYNNHGSSMISPCEDALVDLPKQNIGYASTFDRSWHALESFKSRLHRDVAQHRYSHIIVAVMGLDTAQEEAIRNYRSIISSIRLNAGSDFKPLFIGITWPSFYANRWFDPIWEVLAYNPVSDRADIMGLTWLGVLLNDVIMPLSDNAPVSIIAHSFGARAASMALCVGPAILPPERQSIRKPPSGTVENFVGLAPAFSMARFNNEDYRFYENIYYKDHCPMIERFVFTVSRDDSAFDLIFWSDPVGKHKIMTDYCMQSHSISVSCTSTDAEGNINDYNPAAKVSYIDASSVMQYTMPGTEGGGHSDIYRAQVGRMLWMILNGERR